MQITLALHAYHNEHGNFPPAYQLGPDGKPWHSWRVLILPYIEYHALYDQYDFDEPWDGPNNRELWSAMPEIYQCPGYARAAEEGVFDELDHRTKYSAIVGPHTAWRGVEAVKAQDITDILSNSILVMESTKSACWLEPSDLSYEQALKQLSGSLNTGHHSPSSDLFSASSICSGRSVAFADGSVHYFPNCIPLKTASALLTIDGGENVDLDADVYFASDLIYGYGPTVIKWRVVYPFAVFVILSLLPAAKLFKRKPISLPVQGSA